MREHRTSGAFDRPADRVLQAARTLWPEQPYQADSDVLGVWRCNCPCCQGELALTVTEAGEETGGPISLVCQAGCAEAAIRSAFGLDLPPSIASAQRLRSTDGATFVLDAPETVPAIWGSGQEVLWAEGESLLIVAPQGVGKTTLGGQLAFKRHGIGDPELLGFPVAMDPKRVLYLALDRPHQVRRSFRRMVTEADRHGLSYFAVWSGPLPFDAADDPDAFPEFVSSFGAGTVFIDSLKDAAVGLSDDTVGSRVNLAIQRTIAAGIDVVALHHQRKATSDNKRPTTLADVYGSTWLTAGAGSVVLLWGKPGDPIVELRHLKQPAAEVGPLTVLHDHISGTSTVHEPVDLLELVRTALSGGLTVKEAAMRLYGTGEPDPNEVEKARRKLDHLARRGLAAKVDAGNGEVVRYRPVELRSAA